MIYSLKVTWDDGEQAVELGEKEEEHYIITNAKVMIDTIDNKTLNKSKAINAKIEIAPELTRQLVIEFTPQKTIYSLYDGKTLVETIAQEVEEGFAQQFKSVLVQLAGKLGSDYTVFFERRLKGFE